MENSAFIYIPDISGFTKFVTETEISHSQHIISELIEIIIESNELEFNISEVEGDAVLFYQKGNAPSIVDVFNQTKKMFTKFHEHLAIIKRDNVCQCGACQTSSNLSLKFVSHYGELKEVAIRSFNKILGSDVILAHRLLKNNLSSKEYVLFTEAYLNTQKQLNFDELSTIKLNENIEKIENFGDVATQYVILSDLRMNITIPSKQEVDDTEIYKDKSTILIKAPIERVHNILIDINAKLNWVPGIKSIENLDKINRVNTKHTCNFEKQSVSFITLDNTKKNGKIKYSELVELNSGLFFVVNYLLYKENGSTKVSFFIEHANEKNSNQIKPLGILNKLKEKILLVIFNRNLRKTMSYFKSYCEQLD